MKFVINKLELRMFWGIYFSLLPLVTIGCSNVHDPNSKSAAEFVLKQGGKVIRVGSDLPIVSPAKIPTEEFAIREIDLTDSKIKNIDMKHLSNLPYLESLNLHGTGLTNKGLAQITDLPNLQSLELAYTRVTDEEVSKLTRFPKLRKVFLYGTPIKPQTVEDLKSNLKGCAVYK